MKRLFFLFLFLIAAQSGQARLVEKVVATVGEEMISLSDLRSFRSQLQAGLVSDSLLFKILPKSQITNNQSSRLQFLVFQKIMNQISKEQTDFVISKENQNRIFKKIRGSRSTNSFAKLLKANGIQVKTLKSRISSYVRNDQLLSKEILSKISISNNEIDSYHFNKYGGHLFTDFEYEFDSLSFPNNKKGRDAARKLLTDVASSSFNQVIKQKGLQIKTSRLKKSEINPLMYQALKDLSVSQFSKPVLLSSQIYVLRLKWKTPVLTPAKQKRQASIQKQLFEKELKREMKKWLAKQETNFSTKIFL